MVGQLLDERCQQAEQAGRRAGDEADDPRPQRVVLSPAGEEPEDNRDSDRRHGGRPEDQVAFDRHATCEDRYRPPLRTARSGDGGQDHRRREGVQTEVGIPGQVEHDDGLGRRQHDVAGRDDHPAEKAAGAPRRLYRERREQGRY